MISGVKLKWGELSGRERIILSGGVAISLGVLLYVSLIDPHYRKYEVLKNQVPQKIETYAWMRVQANKIRPLLEAKKTAASQPVDGLSLVSVVEASARKMKLTNQVRRIQPGKSGEVKIWFSEVYFNTWLEWLDQLQSKGIQAVAVRVDRGENNATNIQATLMARSESGE
ncbi:MAG: hypothetical protein DHS20C01_06420 [marine bacterium B5-7]|nr:MAG: hypothetical protein DHS20C01_06420 [marine bacterium B5-7]